MQACESSARARRCESRLRGRAERARRTAASTARAGRARCTLTTELEVTQARATVENRACDQRLMVRGRTHVDHREQRLRGFTLTGGDRDACLLCEAKRLAVDGKLGQWRGGRYRGGR